jgi:hypothetical protein
MTWAFGLPLEPRAKIALLAIADNADDEGIAWPSRDLIASKSSQSRATINRRMKFLVDLRVLGVFERYREDGSQTTDEIRLDLALTADEVMRRTQALKASETTENDAESADEDGGEGGCQPASPPEQISNPGGADLTPRGYHCGNPQSEPSVEPVAVADDACARPLVEKLAMDLAERLLVIAGHDPKFWPPGWCGAPMRVQTWLNTGWPAEIIVAAVRGVVARNTGPPAKSVQYFENAIAEEIARQSRPVPEISNVQAASGHRSSTGKGNAYARIAARLGQSSGGRVDGS